MQLNRVNIFCRMHTRVCDKTKSAHHIRVDSAFSLSLPLIADVHVHFVSHFSSVRVLMHLKSHTPL